MYQEAVYPLLRLLEAETAHHLILDGLSRLQDRPGLRQAVAGRMQVHSPRLAVSAFGLQFSNPLGLAAGLDKDVIAPGSLAALGFGCVEVGTITPRPQPGRPRPRVFRLIQDHALINRLGFPSRGVEEAVRRLQILRKPDFVLGVNIGPNADSVAKGTEVEDFVTCLQAVQPFADYVTINVSSPNTQGLRLMQHREALDRLLQALFAAAESAGSAVPILVKLSPDMDEGELAESLDVICQHGVAGVIATNTTLARPPELRSPAKNETGGLSGKPLRDRSTAMIRAIRRRTGGKLPIIGVGGVWSAGDVVEKMRAGASLVQIYTGLIYQGPAVARDINRELLAYLDRNKLHSLQQLVGADSLNVA